MLTKELFQTVGGHDWYDVHSDTEGKGVLQVETGVIYSGVAMRDDDPYTYEECDDPNYVAPESDASEPSDPEIETPEILG